MVSKAAYIIFLTTLLAVSGCGNGENPTSYQDNKKMVLDMLKTDEGKQTVKELFKDKQLRSEIVMDETSVKQTITETLTADQSRQIWNDLLKDPDFAERLAKTMERENEQLLKKLMKEPDYQGMMADILKDPGLQKQYLDLLKTKPFRQQVERSIQDAVSSPVFQKELSDTISDALKKQQTEKAK